MRIESFFFSLGRSSKPIYIRFPPSRCFLLVLTEVPLEGFKVISLRYLGSLSDNIDAQSRQGLPDSDSEEDAEFRLLIAAETEEFLASPISEGASDTGETQKEHNSATEPNWGDLAQNRDTSDARVITLDTSVPNPRLDLEDSSFILAGTDLASA